MSKERGANHKAAQKAGRARDLETCQICGNKGNAEGHHIFDYAFGGAADKDNIITLCHDCHKDVHSGKIELFKF